MTEREQKLKRKPWTNFGSQKTQIVSFEILQNIDYIIAIASNALSIFNNVEKLK